jgi:hypothetical protein
VLNSLKSLNLINVYPNNNKKKKKNNNKNNSRLKKFRSSLGQGHFSGGGPGGGAAPSTPTKTISTCMMGPETELSLHEI